MPRREKPAKSNQTTDPTMIPQWRGPKSEKICPRLQREEKRDHPPRGCCRLGKRCEGDRPLLGPEPNESGAGQQFSGISVPAGNVDRPSMPHPPRGCPIFDVVSAQEKRLTRRVQMAGCRLAYFARSVASFASYSRALFGQNEIAAGSRETRRSWAKIAECHKGKRK
jgi:hypothetical protein